MATGGSTKSPRQESSEPPLRPQSSPARAWGKSAPPTTVLPTAGWGRPQPHCGILMGQPWAACPTAKLVPPAGHSEAQPWRPRASLPTPARHASVPESRPGPQASTSTFLVPAASSPCSGPARIHCLGCSFRTFSPAPGCEPVGVHLSPPLPVPDIRGGSVGWINGSCPSPWVGVGTARRKKLSK